VPFHPDQCPKKSKATVEVSIRDGRDKLDDNLLIEFRDRRVEELEKRLAWMEGQLRLPLEGRQFPGDLESGTDPKAQDIAGFNEYRPTYITSHAFGKSLLGSAPPEIEESARVSQTSNITTPSQQSIPSPNEVFQVPT
jgi:hypothetical protein